MSEWRLFISDELVVLGTIALTLTVIGVIRIPHPQAKIHAASKGVTFGVLVILAAGLAASPVDVVVRTILVGVFLLLTSAVGSHALAKLAAQLSGDIEVDNPQISYDTAGQDTKE